MRIGRSPDFRRAPFTYKCSVCNLATSLTAADYARIPEATLDDLREAGLAWMVENDLRGQGAEEQEIEALREGESLERGIRQLSRTVAARARSARVSKNIQSDVDRLAHRIRAALQPLMTGESNYSLTLHVRQGTILIRDVTFKPSVDGEFKPR